MKKELLLVVSVITIAIIVSVIGVPSNASSSAGSSNPSVKSSIPDSVSKILEKSCFPCHSAPGKRMAMSHVDFDKWDTYKPKKQADKAEDMCKELTKGAMPPKSFRSNNPDKVPTDAEVQVICKWSASFPEK
jgi:hypothetical protein